MRSVTKNIFLNTLVCPGLGWLYRHNQIKRETGIGTQFIMEQGVLVEEKAREVFPDGYLIDEIDLQASLEKTQKMVSEKYPCIFAPIFQVGNYRTKADVLKLKEDGAWHMIEVKSSTNDKDEFIEDMAYTTMVLQRAGISLTQISIMLISKDYRLDNPISDLFKTIDHTTEVLERVEKFSQCWDAVDEITGQVTKPDSELLLDCKKCPVFSNCLGNGVENHIFDLPYLRKNKFDLLTGSGISKIEDIPPDFKLSSKQKIVYDSVIKNIEYVNIKLPEELSKITYPAYYLDFETINTALPLYPEVAPYTQIPTQYSIHKCRGSDAETEHFEFLANHEKDDRREFAVSLIKTLGDKGSIVVYSSFEKTTINKLAEQFPDLEEDLNKIVNRLVDINSIIRNNYYHPEMHGSNSIKSVAPALIPDISYDELDISDGSCAMAEFAYLAMGKYEGDDIEKIRSNLLEYCKLDTYSLYQLHQALLTK